MKKIILILTLTSCGYVNASELEKLSHMPSAGAIYFSAGLGNLLISTSITGPAGKVADNSQTATSFQYTLGYGLSENIALGIRGSYLLSNSSEYKYGMGSTLNGTSATYKKTGLKEPSFAIMWRTLNNTKTKTRVQLFAGLQPQLLTAKEAGTSSDGNNAIGGHEIQLGFNIYKEINDVELAFNLRREILMSKKAEEADNSNKTIESTDHQKTALQVGLQGFVSASVTLGGNLILESTEGYNSKYYTNSVLTTNLEYDSASITSLEAISKIKMTDASLLQITLAKVLSASYAAKIGSSKLNTNVDNATSILAEWVQEF
jgi:hypothetical protein